MAKSSGGIKITRTLQNINDEIKSVNSNFKSAQNAANNFAKSLKIDPHNPALLKSYYASIKDEIAACTKKIQLMKEKQDLMVSKNGEGIAKATTQYKELDSKIAATNAKIQELNASLKGSNMLSFSLLQTGLQKVAQTASKIIGTIKNIGESYAETATAISKSSKMFGVSAEEYQKQAYAWEKVTDDAEAYNTVMNATLGVVSKVSTGNQKVVTDLANVGLTLEDLKGKSSQETLSIITSAISKLGTEAERQAASLALFGNTAGVYVTQMAETSTSALVGYRSEIEETGLMTNEQVAKGANLAKTFEKIKMSIKAMVASMGEALVPLFEQFGELIKNVAPTLTAIAKGLSAIGPAGVVVVGTFMSIMSILPTLVATMAAFKYSIGDIGHATATLALLAAAVGIGAGITAKAIMAVNGSKAALADTTNTTYTQTSTNNNSSSTQIYNDNREITVNNNSDVDADKFLDSLNEKYISFKKIGG